MYLKHSMYIVMNLPYPCFQSILFKYLTPPSSFPFPPSLFTFSVSSRFPFSAPPLFLSFSTLPTPFPVSISSSSNAQSPLSSPSPSPPHFYISPNLIFFPFKPHFSGHFPLHRSSVLFTLFFPTSFLHFTLQQIP